MRILSGIQPSGKLHLGNYFGAIQQFVTYQDKADEALYFIANLHALTSLRDGPTLLDCTRDVALDFLALGLNPDKAIIFRQSDLHQHAELAWILGTVTPMALLERGHSYKDKIARGISADVGLFYYPVLMAADILLYGADYVPVGQDQKQHLEFTRDIATKFNMTYVPNYNPQNPDGILKLPEPIILDNIAVIPGIDGQKMSKSYHNTIELFAPDDIIRKKIMSIQTDSTPVDAPKPEGGHLLTLLELLATPNEAQEHQVSWKQGGVGYGTYKKRLVELFFEKFGDARAKRMQLMQDLTYVDDVLKQGAHKARSIALPIFQNVCQAVGVPFHV